IPQPYPGRRPVPEGAKRPAPAKNADMLKGADEAAGDIPKGHNSPDGVWDQGTLGSNANLKTALDDFAAGKKAPSVKNVDHSGKTPVQIDKELSDAGFTHNREPLAVPTKDGPMYRRRDGTLTKDAADPDIVPHDIYLHPDGGMVRVKPEGDPGN